MKKIAGVLLVIISFFSFNGCLLFHKLSYDVKLEEPNKGTATVIFYDIRSDAKTENDLKADTSNLFDYILRGQEFLAEIKKEGKNMVSRELFVSGDALNGKAVFKFENISAVERIIYEDGFFYLTLPLADSVISTNGEIIYSKEYKRILWDGTERNLKFEIYSTDFADGEYRKLAPFFKQ